MNEGSCVVLGQDANYQKKHQNCRCSSIATINDCSEKCENDHQCKAYTYAKKYSKCYLFTTTDCKDGCSRMKWGNTGRIIEKYQKNSAESGCFIKKRRKHLPSSPSYKKGTKCI